MIFAIRMSWKASPPSMAEGIKTVYADAHTQEEAEALFQKSHYVQNLRVDHLEIKPALGQGPDDYIVHESMISEARKQEIALPANLLQALKEALFFIETSRAVEGKALTEAQWDAAVLEFQQSSVSQIGIGRCYIEKAIIKLTDTRDLIKYAETKIKLPRG